MTLQAASTLGIDVVIGEREPGAPATHLTPLTVLFPSGWDDPTALAQLADLVPVVTLENEFIDADVLDQIVDLGCTVLPSPACVRVVQDKLTQKQALDAVGLPLPPYQAVESPAEVASFGQTHGWPLMLKARRNGYDGRGNQLVRAPSEAESACRQLGWPDRGLYVEANVPFVGELATIVVRTPSGETNVYPVVETRQDPRLHICREVLAPASVPLETAERASAIARTAVEAVNGSGAFGVEMFLLPDDQVWVNELAPRPHNSGHYTIEGCHTSQFANHVRALFGLPLGPVTLQAPAVAMVNLLGNGPDLPTLEQVRAALAVPGAYVHVYGKTESRVGRKMGHVTALGETTEDALAVARRAARALFPA